MTTQSKANRKPTHGVYHVRGEGKAARWTQVGAAWLHEDKQGLNVTLDYTPVAEGKLVIRVKADKPAADSHGEAE